MTHFVYLHIQHHQRVINHLKCSQIQSQRGATCERSISTLRFLKDELRSTMTNRRLNGLALMFIHRDLTKHLNIDDIVDEFAREHPRRMELVNLLSDDAETV